MCPGPLARASSSCQARLTGMPSDTARALRKSNVAPSSSPHSCRRSLVSATTCGVDTTASTVATGKLECGLGESMSTGWEQTSNSRPYALRVCWFLGSMCSLLDPSRAGLPVNEQVRASQLQCMAASMSLTQRKRTGSRFLQQSLRPLPVPRLPQERQQPSSHHQRQGSELAVTVGAPTMRKNTYKTCTAARSFASRRIAESSS